MESVNLFAALMLNAVIVAMELFVMSRLANKKDILKYYTYLSNLIALITSAVFVVVTALNLINGNFTPLWLKGIRFSATYMLVTTLFVFSVVLLPWDRSGNTISQSDFLHGVSPRLANLVLHYLCPLISAASFILFERQPILAGSEWTLYGAIPTILYWIMYFIMTATHLWEDPYSLGESEKASGSGMGFLLFLLIPLMSMGLDYLLWWLNTLTF